jgi:hypothetical protein
MYALQKGQMSTEDSTLQESRSGAAQRKITATETLKAEVDGLSLDGHWTFSCARLYRCVRRKM